MIDLKFEEDLKAILKAMPEKVTCLDPYRSLTVERDGARVAAAQAQEKQRNVKVGDSKRGGGRRGRGRGGDMDKEEEVEEDDDEEALERIREMAEKEEREREKEREREREREREKDKGSRRGRKGKGGKSKIDKDEEFPVSGANTIPVAAPILLSNTSTGIGSDLGSSSSPLGGSIPMAIPEGQTPLYIIPETRQTFMFSATMAPAVAKIAPQYLLNPVMVTIGEEGQTVDNIIQVVEVVENDGEKKKVCVCVYVCVYVHVCVCVAKCMWIGMVM
jgi:hypothetical protein